MNHMVIHYGLTAEQETLLSAALPVEYELTTAECVTDLIVTDATCIIIGPSSLDKNALNTLLAYYMDVGDRLVETVVWLGDVVLPNLPSFVRCDNFLDMLTELESILTRAQARYDTMQVYTGEYGYLPRHAIAESLEADVYAALYRKYGDNPDVDTVRLVRRQWQTVLEAGAAEELAAVYELTRWLKGQSYQYELKCTTPFPFILELLDITETNSRSKILEADYAFVLSKCLETHIEQWRKHHWLNKLVAYHCKMPQFVFQEEGI